MDSIGPLDTEQVAKADELTHLDAELDLVLIGGREALVIDLVEYDCTWPERFNQERHRSSEALGPLVLRIEHIGSTAVPGLAAKAIVDIVIEIANLDDEDFYRGA